MKALTMALLLSSSLMSRAEWRTVTLSHFCACKRCCGPQAHGMTASGKRFRPGILAADPSIPFGARIQVDGQWREVLDRGGAIKGNRLDLAVRSHREARRKGVREVKVLMP